MKRITTIAVSLVLVISSLAFSEGGSPYDLQKTFTVSPGGKLVVSVSAGDIHVSVWDKPQVEMTVQNIDDDADRVQTSQDGNTIHVQYRPHGGWLGDNRDLRFNFYVPRQFSLDLSTSGGDVSVGGKITGTVTMSTSGGDLKIDDVDGIVNGRSSGGDITAHDVSDGADFSTAGGDLSVSHAGADLKVSTAGGEITVGSVVRNLDASTAGGDIKIDNVGGKLHATTSSGDVTIGKVGGSVSLSTAGGDITLVSGNGKISANTSGGDITVSSAVGSADVMSSGGTIKVGLTPEGNDESRIESSGGDVYLYIPASAKATIKVEVSGGGPENDIVSDFPVSLLDKSGYGYERAKVVLNGGGQEISLHTSSGSVYIKKYYQSSR